MKRLAGAVLLAGALALAAFAWRCDEAWFDRHVFWPQQFFITADHRLVFFARAAAAAIAALLVLLIRVTSPARILFAVLLAVPAAEVALQWKTHRLLQREQVQAMEALTSADPRYGVTLEPSIDRVQPMAGRDIRWITDADRRRIPGSRIDPALPSLVFTGESTVAGAGLQWHETFPALLGARLHLQVVNLASMNYRLDQSRLRLEDALPRLARPAAVVGLFMPGLVGRERQREAANLWQRSGLYRMWRHLYWSDAELADAMIAVSAALREMAAQAKARSLPCIFVVTGHTPRWMLHELFELPGLDHVVVEVPGQELLSDGHPGPLGALRIAGALEPRLVQSSD